MNYSFYLQYTHRGAYRHGKHTKLIADELQRIEKQHAEGIPTFTIFTMPPRHSKSMTITETFPSWFIGRNPSRNVIEVSYGADLAVGFGRQNKRKLEEFGPDLFDLEVDPERGRAADWGIAGHRGGMVSAGVGGAITGKGADLLLIDDPIKNRREADSETYRNFIWNEWTSTLETRLQPGGSVIIILTRWHEDDLCGRLLLNDDRPWRLINLPAIAEEEDLLGRKPGEALWPEVGFDETWAAQKKKSVGSRDWASLFQQQPSPGEGNMLQRDHWKYYKRPPSRFDELIQSWDCTFKDHKDSDFVVGQVWGRTGADMYLIDQVRGKMNITATIQAVRSLSAKYPQAHGKLVEDKANGTAVIQILNREIPGLIPVNPEGGKVARANAALPFIEAGNVFLPDPSMAAWIHDFVEEAANFPNAANDDMVDAMTQAVLKLAQPFEPLIGRA